MANVNPYTNIEYYAIDTYRNFENGIKQVQLMFPHGTQWAFNERGKEYWTIVSNEFYEHTKWHGPFERARIFDKWIAIFIRDIDHHEYFDCFGSTPEEMVGRLHLENRIFALIKDSSVLGGLLRFGKMNGVVGQATYIQTLSHGIQNKPLYGIYTDPNTNITQPDVFGTGKWLEVSPSKAGAVWYKLYNWVLDKMAFIDKPCPLILNCIDAYEVWKAASVNIMGSKYDINEIVNLEPVILDTMVAKIADFASQFFDGEVISKVQDAARTVDYELDYIDEDERHYE